MIRLVKILSLNDNNEREVVLKFDEFEITCFITSSPYLINVNNNYMAEISLFFINDFVEICESNCKIGFKKIDDSYKYYLVGFLNDNKLFLNEIYFEDDIFLDFYMYAGNKVMVVVDRIDVAFL